MIVSKLEMNFRTKSIVTSTERSSLMVVGVFKSTIALIRSPSILTNTVNGPHMPTIMNLFRSKIDFGWF